MNRLFWVNGVAIFVVGSFLITNTPSTTMAYGCSKSSNANHTNSSSGVNGTSGNLTKGALTSSSHIFGVGNKIVEDLTILRNPAIGSPCGNSGFIAGGGGGGGGSFVH